jgi:hypothetical protein
MDDKAYREVSPSSQSLRIIVYVLKDDSEENITTNEEVVEWVRENCDQDVGK